jgi:hypothetical protein
MAGDDDDRPHLAGRVTACNSSPCAERHPDGRDSYSLRYCAAYSYGDTGRYSDALRGSPALSNRSPGSGADSLRYRSAGGRGLGYRDAFRRCVASSYRPARRSRDPCDRAYTLSCSSALSDGRRSARSVTSGESSTERSGGYGG